MLSRVSETNMGRDRESEGAFCWFPSVQEIGTVWNF